MSDEHNYLIISNSVTRSLSTGACSYCRPQYTCA